MRRAPRVSVPYALVLFCMVWAALVLLLPGCAARNVINIERPNARTTLEEKAYNTLLVSERIITTAEASNTAGTLPTFMKPIINTLIDIHNETKKAADVYVASLDAEDGSELDALILSLNSAITSLFTGAVTVPVTTGGAP